MKQFVPQYCPYCGQELAMRDIDGRERKYCESCDRTIYRNPKPTAGTAVVDGGSVLLIKRGIPPKVGMWGIPAGFMEVDETPEETAVRELAEETSLEVDPDALTLVDIVSDRNPVAGPLVSIGYVVPRSKTRGEPTPGDEVDDVRFWDPDELDDTGREQLRPHDTERVRNAIQTL